MLFLLIQGFLDFYKHLTVFQTIDKVYFDSFAQIFFLMLWWGNCVFEQPTSLCALITLITNFTYTTYMQLASVILDQPKFLVIFETIKHRFYIFTICTVSSTYFMMHNSLYYQYKQFTLSVYYQYNIQFPLNIGQ